MTDKEKLEALERREKELYAQFAHLPNNEERARLYGKWKHVADQISAIIYDHKGNYIGDKI